MIEQSASENITPSASFRKEFQAQNELRAKQADVAYEKAQQGGLQPTPELLQELQHDAVKEALAKGARTAAKTGVPMAPGEFPDVRQAESAYRIIRDKADELFNAGHKEEARYYGDLRDRLKTALDASSPGGVLPAARAEFEHNSQVLDAMKQGRAITSKSMGEKGDELNNAFFDKLPNAHPDVKQGLLVGIHNALSEPAAVNIETARNMARKFSGASLLLNRLEASIGPEKTAAVKKTMGDIARYAQTRDIVTPTTGSQTFPLAASAARQEGGNIVENMQHLAGALAGSPEAALRGVGKIVAHVKGALNNPETETAARMARAKLLTEGFDEESLKRIARLLQQGHGKYSAPVAGVTGGQVGPQAGQ
jgi:hypothetical protein